MSFKKIDHFFNSCYVYPGDQQNILSNDQTGKMRQSQSAWLLGILFPNVYEKESQFRDFLARLVRAGMLFGGFLTVSGVLLYVVVNTLFLDRGITLFPKFGADLTISLADKFIIAFLGIICIIATRFRRVLYWGRAIVFMSIL